MRVFNLSQSTEADRNPTKNPHLSIVQFLKNNKIKHLTAFAASPQQRGANYTGYLFNVNSFLRVNFKHHLHNNYKKRLTPCFDYFFRCRSATKDAHYTDPNQNVNSFRRMFSMSHSVALAGYCRTRPVQAEKARSQPPPNLSVDGGHGFTARVTARR